MIATHTIPELVAIGRQAEQHGGRAEIVGHWVWVRFDCKPTDETRETMKRLGYKWSKSKGRWYFAGAISTSVRAHSWSQITARYAPTPIADLAAAEENN